MAVSLSRSTLWIPDKTKPNIFGRPIRYTTSLDRLLKSQSLESINLKKGN